jgi:hypothetical protein
MSPDIPLDDPDRALAAALLDEVMVGDHSRDSADAVIAQALKRRAAAELRAAANDWELDDDLMFDSDSLRDRADALEAGQ